MVTNASTQEEGGAAVSTNTTTIDDLPEELLYEVFCYLSFNTLQRVGDVSRRWARISQDPLLWRSYPLELRGVSVEDFLESVGDKPLTNLTLTQNGRHNTPELFGALARFSNSLRTLRVGGQLHRSLEETNLCEYLRPLTSLTSLTIRGLKDQVIPVEVARELEHLDFEVRSSLPAAIKPLLECRKLRTLILTASKKTVEGHLPDLFINNPHLTRFEFGWADSSFPHLAIALSSCAVSLKVLSLPFNYQVTDELMVRVLPLLPALTSLNLYCTSVSDATVGAVLECCPHLRVLNLGQTAINDSSLLALADGRLGQLDLLNIFECPGVSREGRSLLKAALPATKVA